ncbi:metallophosphatase, partial [Bacteroides sp. OttesenSCG-928-D19]|nr:metallophosphatase [Bacteroides sp. OttesenSCG-928-D19]
YEGKFKQTADLTPIYKVSEGVMKNISIAEAQVEDHFGYTFRSWIYIPEKGVYRFYTFSDDGSRLLIDGQTIVDNDGSHNSRRKDGKVALEAGFHELCVLYIEDYMGQILEVGFSSRDIRETTIPDHQFFLPE